MATVVPTTISAGSYVIRERETAAVLHVRNPNDWHAASHVLVSPQDESQFPDQQIWWVEPLAHRPGALDNEPVYSITATGSYKALDNHPGTGTVCASHQRGVPRQMWGIRAISGPPSVASFYTIFNAASTGVLAFTQSDPGTATLVVTQPVSVTGNNTHWEFVRPITAFPPGWFEIKNVVTGDLLSQDYEYNEPVLLPPHNWPVESHYRAQWQYQWTLMHSRWFEPATSCHRNSWYIINRLTRAPLCPSFGSDDNRAWKLELDMRRNWKLVNRGTSGLLVPTETNTPACSVVPSGPRRSSWILRYSVGSYNVLCTDVITSAPLRFTDAFETWTAGYDTE